MAAKKKHRRRVDLPEPMPPIPPGPTSGLLGDRHGEAALSLLLLVTLVVFTAVSLGLSIYNTYQVAKIKDTVKFVERLSSKEVSGLKGAMEAAEPTDAEAMVQKAEELMEKAQMMMEKTGATGTPPAPAAE